MSIDIPKSMAWDLAYLALPSLSRLPATRSSAFMPSTSGLLSEASSTCFFSFFLVVCGQHHQEFRRKVTDMA